MHVIVVGQVQHLQGAYAGHQFHLKTAQGDCSLLLGIKRQGVVCRLLRKAAHTDLGRGIDGTLWVEHLSVAIVLVKIPVATYEQTVGNPAARNLQPGIRFQENIQWLAVHILRSIIDVGENQGVILTLLIILHSSRETLQAHRPGA